MSLSLSALSGSPDPVANAIVIGATGGVLALLFGGRFRHSQVWRATVTALASIIGSGFLVVAPLLAFTVGPWALPALAAIVGLAYLVGIAVRYNIRRVEQEIRGVNVDPHRQRVVHRIEQMAKFALAFAYLVAIAFYAELLGAFALVAAGLESVAWQKAVATALLLFVAGFGYFKGLRTLEGFETVAVNAKLAVIAGLIAAMAYFNIALAINGQWALPATAPDWSSQTLRELLGMFLIIQGFETSRYLAGVYTADLRIRTMRYAQGITAAVYLTFIALATVLFGSFGSIDETEIISFSGRVALLLPALLVIGAVMSQFSAVVADTLSGGGLVEEASRGALVRHDVYAAISGAAILLIWSFDIFTVIAYASRAFAVYYALQCGLAAYNAWNERDGGTRLATTAGFAVLALAMVAVAVLGIPAEGRTA